MDCKYTSMAVYTRINSCNLCGIIRHYWHIHAKSKRTEKKGKENTERDNQTQLVNATCPMTSFGLPALPMSLFHRDCFKGWC
jgi:hypothetical protein